MNKVLSFSVVNTIGPENKSSRCLGDTYILLVNDKDGSVNTGDMPDQSSTNRYLCYVLLGICGFFSLGLAILELIKDIEFSND